MLTGVVYPTVTHGQHIGNDRTIQCITEEVKCRATTRQVLLLRDFNGHINPTDGFQD